MRPPIKLPAGPLIEYWTFCKSIARTLRPADEEDITGLDCITGKIVTHLLPMEPAAQAEWWPNGVAMQSVLVADDGSTLDQLMGESSGVERGARGLDLAEPVRVQVVELSLPYNLTDDDRRALVTLLPRLPALRYPIPEEDGAAFMDAYFHLKGRPAWEPVLLTYGAMEQRKAEQDALLRHHQQSLLEEFTQSRLVAVDSRHVPVAALSAGCFLLRDQAIIYLNRLGLAWCDQQAIENHAVEGANEARTQPEPSGEVDSVREGGRPSKKWTLERVKKMHSEYMQNTSLAEEVARRYDIRSPRMYQVFAEHNLPAKSSSGRKRAEKQQRPGDRGTQSLSLEDIGAAWRRGNG